ncbi:uncharacterized protein LOC123491977 [Coregonus clupeaformis]|uniref:uncharacterized protein LOC123491977 n=1 Tax=Coregonus clupeaformis TaxID=59861 RepID=UPI001E1C732E|nr:uncharacterized protein LOC123491977 [Coregonus clupeaformis]
MVGLTDAEVYSHLGRREMTLHCRCRTHGAVETELFLMDTLGTFNIEKGHDTLGIPLLDPVRIQAIWQEQWRHLSCIQDPPGVQLYTDTGEPITKGGVKLPVYCYTRSSTSLEWYHLHLNRFIPGTSANGMHFQAFLLDGLARWNDRISLCTATVATCSIPSTSSFKGCMAQVRLRTSPSLACTEGNSLVLSTCTPRPTKCCRPSAWTLTLRTRPTPPRDPWRMRDFRRRRMRTPLSTSPTHLRQLPHPPPLRQPGQVIQLTLPGLGHPVRPPPTVTLLRPLNTRILLPLTPPQALRTLYVTNNIGVVLHSK